MIPETKLAAVAQALQEAFGVSEFEAIERLTAGLTTALVFRITVRGKPYLLRIITRTDAMSDPTLQFTCMKVAAEAGLAPRIWYTSVADKISITDFVASRPFPLGEAKTRLPDLLRRLHSLPPFPHASNYFEAVNAFIRQFQNAKLLPESTTEELFRHYACVADIYPRLDQQLVSCHNDLKPENILFDGAQAWLVDWEAAFLNDRYADLAVVANFVVANAAEETAYLHRYFGEPAGEYRHARFFLMRQVVHMFYFTVFMVLAAGGKPVGPNMTKPDFREFHDRIWAGEISLAGDEAKLQYAWVHLEQLSRNMKSHRFEVSLRIVAEYNLTKVPPLNR